MYKGSKINHEPLSKEKAEESLSSIIMNYGYKAELVEIREVTPIEKKVRSIMGLPVEKRNELDDRLVEDGVICYETGFNDGYFDTNDFDNWLLNNENVSQEDRETAMELISQYLKTK